MERRGEGYSEAQLNELRCRLHDTQQQLMQAGKMASIGQLAAGVAHEINNPVGYVKSNLSTLQEYLSDLLNIMTMYQKLETEVAEDNHLLLEIRSQCEKVDLAYIREDIVNLTNESQEGMARILQIIQDLKDFSHVDRTDWQFADLHAGLDSTLNIVNNELKYKATVIKEYDPGVPQIECILSQLNKVFMNLLVNAAHAIPDHGDITVRTIKQDAERVIVEISDTGTGIEKDQLQDIFEPFYTTKPQGQGTGLGLAMARDIITRHCGDIEVLSEPGSGTTFRLRLPVRQHRTEPNEPAVQQGLPASARQ